MIRYRNKLLLFRFGVLDLGIVPPRIIAGGGEFDCDQHHSQMCGSAQRYAVLVWHICTGTKFDLNIVSFVWRT